MKKTQPQQPKIKVVLSSGVSMEITVSDPVYLAKYANELRVTGTLLGAWIKTVDIIDEIS
jgi:hypothetical protein